MGSSNLVYVFAWLGVLAVNAVMVYIAWQALFGDREKGTRRCPRCWHNLSATPGLQCGECGRTARREEQLFKVRRSWVRFGFAIIVCLAVAVWIQGRIMQRGWLSLVPTRALIVAMPVFSGPVFEDEMTTRARRGELAAEDWSALVDRCVGGDRRARPPSTEWQTKYGGLVSSWRGRLQLAPELEARLMGIPPYVSASTRGIWPEGAVPRVDVRVQEWWPAAHEIRIRIEPRLDDAAVCTVRRGASPFVPAFAVSLPVLPPGAHDVELAFRVDRRPAPDAPWEPIGDSTGRVRFEVGGSFDEHLKAVDTPEMEEAMRAVFADGWVRWDEGLTPVRVNVNRSMTSTSIFDDVAVGVRVELRCDGGLARRLDLWWPGGRAPNRTRGGWETPFEDYELLAKTTNPMHVWEMRVIGDPDLALRVDSTDRYWAGSFTVPIDAFGNRGPIAPDVPWEVLEEGEGDEAR
jgi:hypothetical protein